jgi:hypothetical protein
MGLRESKVPFEEASGPKTPEIAKEIGICSMWDPRSPSTDIERTPPVFYREDKVEIRDEYVGSVVDDPRSPSNGITRTPAGAEYKNSATDNVYSELRTQLERLQIFDGGIHNTTASSENLGNDSEVHLQSFLLCNMFCSLSISYLLQRHLNVPYHCGPSPFRGKAVCRPTSEMF